MFHCHGAGVGYPSLQAWRHIQGKVLACFIFFLIQFQNKRKKASSPGTKILKKYIFIFRTTRGERDNAKTTTQCQGSDPGPSML